jgi:type II secretory pathway component PulF
MSASHSGSESDQIGAQVVALAAAEVPLGPALRAAAQETPSRRVASALERVAAALERGESLEEALAKHAGRLPPHMATLLVSGEQTGRMREALLDIVEHDEETLETLRTVYAALAYPLLLLGLAYACFVFIELYLVRNMLDLYRDFELELPGPNEVNGAD